MVVTCIANKGTALPESYLVPDAGFRHDTTFDLTVGREYIVYAMTLFHGHMWYYICDDMYTYYPIWNPAALFEVTDSRLPSNWRYSSFPSRNDAGEIVLFAPERWAHDPYYYDQLTDGVREYVENFRALKAVIDQEAERKP